jgi:hypothetical protein
MKRSIASLIVALALAFSVPLIVFGQLPGPPVGAPQAIQNASFGYNFQYTFIPSTTTGAGFRVFPTLNLTTSTGNNDDLAVIGGVVTLNNASTTVTTASALHVGTLTCTLNSGTVTNCANLVVDAAPSTGTNQFSAWFKGNVVVGATNPVSFTGGFSCGASLAAAGTCANTSGATYKVLSGTYLLAGNTSTIVGILPAFTSSTSFNCVANDITTRANVVQAIPASGTSVVITNTTGATDLISMICAGT